VPPEPAAVASDGGAPAAGPVAAEPGTVYEGRPRSSGPPAGVIAGIAAALALVAVLVALRRRKRN